MSLEVPPEFPSASELLRAATATATLRCLPGRFLPQYPVPLRCGVPLPRGKLAGDEIAWLIGPRNEVLPAQAEVLSRWPDGSARWVLVEVVMTVGVETTEWRVLFTAVDPARDKKMAKTRTGHEIDCDLVNSYGLNTWSSPEILTADGQPLRILQTKHGEVVDHRLLHRLILLRTHLHSVRGLCVEVRDVCHLSAGLLQSNVALVNSRRARHSGGLWDLGDDGSIPFHSMIREFLVTDRGPKRVEYQLEPGGVWIDSTPTFSLHQESSGGEQWNSINHVDCTGLVPMRYRGYRAWTAAGEVAGLRATPSVRITTPERRVTATMPDFWQQFPMSLSVEAREDAESRITCGFFPPREGQLHELQGGERKTHTIWLKFDSFDADPDHADLSWVHDPPRLVPVMADQPLVPGWPALRSLDAVPITRLDSLCEEALDGPNSVYVRREQIDEYGWRNFGDFFADHETVYYKGPQPLISHFNNQYDVLGGLLLQGLRTEDRRWFELADPLMRHVTDIDIYHTAEDRAVFNGGLFWLTDHYMSCRTATHRCFSKLNANPGEPYGGGPGCEHNYSTGLLAYFWLTGEPAAKDAVIQLAEWVIAMDDGQQTILGLLDDGPTGTATATAQPEYHGPGRGAGNSINTLLDAWLLTGDRNYLKFAEQFLQRCIHPADDIAQRDLLNFELRWSYTVFLMGVYKYLLCKIELDEFDAEFAYARQSLLHYAAWMLDHERPYFDRVEQMEFPTETWGAQELRKANVFRWAAVFAEEPLRGKLIQKGNEFAERAWHDLCRFPTRTFIRPFTLAMIQGLWDASLRSDHIASASRPSTPASWGKPSDFVPQKTRVKRLLKSPGGLATALLRAVNPRRWTRFLDALRRMT